MQTTAYLTFDGNCAEAFDFFSEALGAEPGMMMRFGEMPDQPEWVTPEMKDRVAHAQINIGGTTIMASDTAGTEPFKGYAGFNLNLTFNDLDQARIIFDRLSDGGTVAMPFEPTFWAKGFGMVSDRFGVPWMINCE